MNDKERGGATKRIEGSLTEALGKLTGDKVTEERGAARKLEGEAEQASAKRKQAPKKPQKSKTRNYVGN